MQDMRNVTKYSFIEQDRPVLGADIAGGADYPDIKGTVCVYALPDGIWLHGEFEGLPKSQDHAFHIHNGSVCDEVGEKLLTLPDVMACADGKASALIRLDRVDHTRIAGKPIVLHIKEDGKEKQMIACGLLERILEAVDSVQWKVYRFYAFRNVLRLGKRAQARL